MERTRFVVRGWTAEVQLQPDGIARFVCHRGDAGETEQLIELD